ncbi:MAG: hypothetical protein P8K08_10410 [Fuerstiella sp.]|nr:hypothetical protein [Fuerstiella sp.]
MARQRKRQANGAPWHRKFDDCWYATIDGKLYARMLKEVVCIGAK